MTIKYSTLDGDKQTFQLNEFMLLVKIEMLMKSIVTAQDEGADFDDWYGKKYC